MLHFAVTLPFRRFVHSKTSFVSLRFIPAIVETLLVNLVSVLSMVKKHCELCRELEM